MSHTGANMLYLMSTTVIPGGADGAWIMESLNENQAYFIAEEAQLNAALTSAVGHQSTAEAMTTALGFPVEMNRITVQPQPGDKFLCFRLDNRPPEGAILDLPTLREIGYSFALMTYFGPYSDIV